MRITGHPMRKIARVGLMGFAITRCASGTAVSQGVDLPSSRTRGVAFLGQGRGGARCKDTTKIGAASNPRRSSALVV
jgi:hypothetical protein